MNILKLTTMKKIIIHRDLVIRPCRLSVVRKLPSFVAAMPLNPFLQLLSANICILKKPLTNSMNTNRKNARSSQFNKYHFAILNSCPVNKSFGSVLMNKLLMPVAARRVERTEGGLWPHRTSRMYLCSMSEHVLRGLRCRRRRRKPPS